MRIVIAMDSFKGSLTSAEACHAAAEGVLSASPSAKVSIIPLSDGGEGLADVLMQSLGGRYVEKTVTGPSGDLVDAGYVVTGTGDMAVIEMAKASGLMLVPEAKRDPYTATSYGTGELIRDALDRGIRKFIIGIGGSATNDGGAGMLQALGFGLLNGRGEDIPRGAAGLGELVRIDVSTVCPEIYKSSFTAACDVSNPLCGSSGASAVFAPQKGAGSEDVHVLDGLLSHFADITSIYFPEADPDTPGSGAAGGMGFALRSYMHAGLESGIDIVIRETCLEDNISECDLVLTGEGKIDRQTAMGKVISGIAGVSRKYKKKVIAFAGVVEDGDEVCRICGVERCCMINQDMTPGVNVMDRDVAYNNLKDAVYKVAAEYI